MPCVDTIHRDARPMGDVWPMCDDTTVTGMHGPHVMMNVTGMCSLLHHMTHHMPTCDHDTARHPTSREAPDARDTRQDKDDQAR